MHHVAHILVVDRGLAAGDGHRSVPDFLLSGGMPLNLA